MGHFISIIILELIVASSRAERWKDLLLRRRSLNRNETDFWLFQDWYQTHWDSVLSVSEKSVSDALMTDSTRSHRTWLLFKAWARHSTPSSPMPLRPIFSVVRLYERSRSSWCFVNWAERLSYPIDLQDISQIFNSFVANSVPFKNQCCQSLCEPQEHQLILVVGWVGE